MKFALDYISAEDKATNYVDIGPVNKVVNMLATYYGYGRNSPQFLKHLARVDDYLWVAEDGMKMQGYNGSQSWDASFALQAMVAGGPNLLNRHKDAVIRVHAFLDATQVREDVEEREKYFRVISKGGWPFSTNDHGWPIADCTSEGLKAVLAMRSLYFAGAPYAPKPISPRRLCDAVDVLAALHNSAARSGDGGWATYEEQRGGSWYEFLNPAEVFGDIMVDYSYTELTSACVGGLTAFQRHFPDYRTSDVAAMISAGTQYVRDQQRPDGSWYGSWAVCFTYGAWFGVDALVNGGDPDGVDAPALRRACDFLLAKQEQDGGWGESYLSCLTKQYSSRPSQAVTTAWALLALTHAQCPAAHAIRRGIDFLISRQRVNGDWAQEDVSGIFNRTCSITYTSYRNIFPLWALGSYLNSYKYRLDTPVLIESIPRNLKAAGTPTALNVVGPHATARGAIFGTTSHFNVSNVINATGPSTPEGLTPTSINSRIHTARSRSRSSGRKSVSELRRRLDVEIETNTTTENIHVPLVSPTSSVRKSRKRRTSNDSRQK
jgi:squalene/oxidosqualene cyclase-like protein